MATHAPWTGQGECVQPVYSCAEFFPCRVVWLTGLPRCVPVRLELPPTHPPTHPSTHPLCSYAGRRITPSRPIASPMVSFNCCAGAHLQINICFDSLRSCCLYLSDASCCVSSWHLDRPCRWDCASGVRESHRVESFRADKVRAGASQRVHRAESVTVCHKPWCFSTPS